MMNSDPSSSGVAESDPRGETAYPLNPSTHSTPAYGVEWLGHNLPDRWPQGSTQAIYLRARNSGSRIWRAQADAGQCVDLVVRVNGHIHLMVRVPHDVLPGAEVTLHCSVLVPFVLFWSEAETTWSFNLVEQNVAWFDDHGVAPLAIAVATLPAETGAAAEALQMAGLTCSAFYLPSGGVTRGRDGRLYPLLARHASGCRIRDLEGNEWIDYVMGWGAALLGYARPEIRAATETALSSGAVLGLPTESELETAQRLCQAIPCAEQTLFGKNGSDVCTAAVRLARVHTGRPLILFNGYSGWQDPFAAAFEPTLAQPGHAPTAFRFAYGDLAQVQMLFDRHEGQIAAVMIEPAAQVEGVDGPVRGADQPFLHTLAELCRQRGALLIFDEIMTGFRHPHGSVQRATGVTPDLACFGKALSSGMPLSALVGRREVMSAIGRIFYHPTFKGEAYSFAAANAALRIYGETNVPGLIENFGMRLMAGVDEVSARLGVAGRMIGLPFRMVYRFDEANPFRRTLLRTLLQQELLKQSVLTFRGFLLPSTAHGEAELDRTLSAYESALRRVREVSDSGSFEQVLEIPPIV